LFKSAEPECELAAPPVAQARSNRARWIFALDIIAGCGVSSRCPIPGGGNRDVNVSEVAFSGRCILMNYDGNLIMPQFALRTSHWVIVSELRTCFLMLFIITLCRLFKY
jgi:hypothetical protein